MAASSQLHVPAALSAKTAQTQFGN